MGVVQAEHISSRYRTFKFIMKLQTSKSCFINTDKYITVLRTVEITLINT